MKKIFMQEWMAARPYRVADSADVYYIGIANKVAAIVKSEISDSTVTDHHRRYIGLFMASWFEDVISNIGVWKAFTDECLKRYGTRVPLYPVGEDYYTDEVNEADVHFLLWHYLQVLCNDRKVISPEDPQINAAAKEVYALLAAEYETAPENESLQQAFYGYTYTESEESIARYFDFLRWFHFRSFLNCENMDRLQQKMEKEAAAQNRMIMEGNGALLQHILMTDSELFDRFDLLSLTSPEWLARIGEGHPETKAWASVKVSPSNYFLYMKKDEEWVYLQDLVSGATEPMRVKRLSFNQAELEKAVDQEVIFATSLVEYMGVWYQRGMLLMAPKTDGKLVTEVARAGNRLDHSQEKADYEHFMQETGGKPVVFFRTKQEVMDFLTRQLGMTMDEVDLSVDERTGAAVMASKEVGVHVQLGLVDCLQSPDNPLYHAESARKGALSFLVSPSVVPYSLSCRLLDEGMLADAVMNSRKGEQYGADLVRQNARFLTDYYFHQCREKDLISQ